MKIFQSFGYPLTIISLFLLLLISGKTFGGSFIVYLFLGFPHAAPYSLFAFFGVLNLCVTMYINGPNKYYWTKPTLMIAGIIFLSLSLLILFQNIRSHYYYIPFEQTVPVVPFVLFGIAILCGLINSLIQIAKLPVQNNGWIKMN